MGNTKSIQCTLCIPGGNDDESSDNESEISSHNNMRQQHIIRDNCSDDADDDSDDSLYEDIIKIKKQIAKEKKKRKVLKARARQERLKRKELQKNFDDELKSSISPGMDDMLDYLDTNSNYTTTMLSSYNTVKTHTHSIQSTHDSLNDGNTQGIYNETQYSINEERSVYGPSNMGSTYNNGNNMIISKPQIVAQTSQPLPPLIQNNDTDIVTSLPQIPVTTSLSLPTNNSTNSHIKVLNTPSGPVLVQHNSSFMNNIVPIMDDPTPRGSLIYQVTPMQPPNMSQRQSIISIQPQQAQQFQPQINMMHRPSNVSMQLPIQQPMPNITHRSSTISIQPPPQINMSQRPSMISIQPQIQPQEQKLDMTPNINKKLKINVTSAPAMVNVTSDNVSTPMEDLQLKINTLGKDQNAMNRALIRMKMMEMGISTEDIFNTMIHNEDTKSNKTRLTNDVSYAETNDTESSMSQRDIDEIEQFKRTQTLKKLNIDE